MATSLSDILATLQNGVSAINNLATQIGTIFPQATALSTSVRGALGTVTFDSSLATAFLAVESSSGFIGWVPVYPSS